MKIAIVYDVLYPYVVGGLQMRNWNVARRLAERGHDVTLFGMKHWEGEDILVRNGVKLHGICRGLPLYTAEGRRAIWPPISFALSLLPHLYRGNFDVVDVANFPFFPCFPARIASALRRSHFIMTWCEVWGSYWRAYLGTAGALGMGVEKICSCLPHSAVAISETTKSNLRSLGYRRDVEVIPCGVDLEAIAAAPTSDARPDVVFFGRLIKEKHVDLLIKAVGLLTKDRPDVRCTVVGDGPERARLEALIGATGVSDQVKIVPFLERQSDVFGLMKAARALVLPSSREGFGIVAIEAHACGLPVITTRHPQNAACSLVRSGDDGFVCDPTPRAIAEHVQLTLDGAISRSACVEAARDFDWNDITSQVEAYYERAACNGPIVVAEEARGVRN